MWHYNYAYKVMPVVPVVAAGVLFVGRADRYMDNHMEWLQDREDRLAFQEWQMTLATLNRAMTRVQSRIMLTELLRRNNRGRSRMELDRLADRMFEDNREHSSREDGRIEEIVEEITTTTTETTTTVTRQQRYEAANNFLEIVQAGGSNGMSYDEISEVVQQMREGKNDRAVEANLALQKGKAIEPPPPVATSSRPPQIEARPPTPAVQPYQPTPQPVQQYVAPQAQQQQQQMAAAQQQQSSSSQSQSQASQTVQVVEETTTKKHYHHSQQQGVQMQNMQQAFGNMSVQAQQAQQQQQQQQQQQVVQPQVVQPMQPPMQRPIVATAQQTQHLQPAPVNQAYSQQRQQQQQPQLQPQRTATQQPMSPAPQQPVGQWQQRPQAQIAYSQTPGAVANFSLPKPAVQGQQQHAYNTAAGQVANFSQPPAQAGFNVAPNPASNFNQPHAAQYAGPAQPVRTPMPQYASQVSQTSQQLQQAYASTTPHYTPTQQGFNHPVPPRSLAPPPGPQQQQGYPQPPPQQGYPQPVQSSHQPQPVQYATTPAPQGIAQQPPQQHVQTPGAQPGPSTGVADRAKKWRIKKPKQ